MTNPRYAWHTYLKLEGFDFILYFQSGNHAIMFFVSTLCNTVCLRQGLAYRSPAHNAELNIKAVPYVDKRYMDYFSLFLIQSSETAACRH